MSELISSSVMFIAIACSLFQFVLAHKLGKIEQKIKLLEGTQNEKKC